MTHEALSTELDNICNKAARLSERENRARDAYNDWRHITRQQLLAIEGRTHEPAALWIDPDSLM